MHLPRSMRTLPISSYTPPLPSVPPPSVHPLMLNPAAAAPPPPPHPFAMHSLYMPPLFLACSSIYTLSSSSYAHSIPHAFTLHTSSPYVSFSSTSFSLSSTSSSITPSPSAFPPVPQTMTPSSSSSNIYATPTTSPFPPHFPPFFLRLRSSTGRGSSYAPGNQVTTNRSRCRR